jgi:hypothetical protein
MPPSGAFVFNQLSRLWSGHNALSPVAGAVCCQSRQKWEGDLLQIKTAAVCVSNGRQALLNPYLIFLAVAT